MKIQINQNSLQLFREKNQPATVTISKSNIAFNIVAKKLLALEKGSGFELEFEDGKLYYKDSNKDAFTITMIGNHVITCALAGIGKYVGNLFNTEETKFKYSLGEFKDGRRELIAI